MASSESTKCTKQMSERLSKQWLTHFKYNEKKKKCSDWVNAAFCSMRKVCRAKKLSYATWQWSSMVDIQAVNSLMITSTSNFCVDEHWRNKVTAELSVVRLLPVRRLTKKERTFLKDMTKFPGNMAIWRPYLFTVYSRPKTIQKYELRKIVAFYIRQYMCIKYAAF